MIKNYKKFFESKNDSYALSFFTECGYCEEDFNIEEPCKDCYGHGVFVDEKIIDCETCDGTGTFKLDYTCNDCSNSNELEYIFTIDKNGINNIVTGNITNFPDKNDSKDTHYAGIDNKDIIKIMHYIFDNPGLNKKDMINLLVRFIHTENLNVYYRNEYEKYFDQETKNTVQSGKGISKFDL